MEECTGSIAVTFYRIMVKYVYFRSI